MENINGNVTQRFVDVLNKEFDKEIVFVQLEELFNVLELTSPEDEYGIETGDLIDLLTSPSLWTCNLSVREYRTSDLLDEAKREGWYSGKVPANPLVYVLHHDNERVADYALPVVVMDGDEIISICLHQD
jgi:hypothetical protein